MTATTSTDDASAASPKNRPDGATPEPETDGLNLLLCQLRDAFTQSTRAESVAQFAAAMVLATAYTAASTRTTIQAKQRSTVITDEAMFRANLRSIVGSIGAATNLSDTALVIRAYDGYRLKTKFPMWLPELSTGDVTMRQAQALLRQANNVPEGKLAEYGERVLGVARTSTPGQTENFAKKLAAQLASEGFEAACEREYAARAVTIQDLDFGMSEIRVYGPTATLQASYDLLTREAKALREENLEAERETKRRIRAAAARGEQPSPEDAAFIDDPRTVAQLRADLFLETILTATPQSILESETAGKPRVTATISIVVPVLPLIDPEKSRDVATLNGTQPMSMDEARHFMGDVTSFDRILTDPINGHTLTVDSRGATADMRRFLKVRDGTCRFPGCRRPASQCELDHTEPWATGGTTSVDNLKYVCKTHHIQKHQKPWRSRHLANGEVEWIDPLGDVLVTKPMVLGPVFVQAEDPAPF